MAKNKKVELFNKKGNPICGAKNKSTVNKKGVARKYKVCHRAPMANGRCRTHGGASTGPKNSLAYWKKTLTDEKDQMALDLENPLDLLGEIGMVRTMLSRMQDDPLKAYCFDCKQWVYVEVKCPNKEHDDKVRRSDGKKTLDHHVKVRDNDFSKVILASKQLSEIAKNHKEILKGKEVTIRIETINLLIARIVMAYETADKLKDPNERRKTFIEGVSSFVVEGAEFEASN